MVQTVLVLVRSSLLGTAIWTGLVLDRDWLPLVVLAATTAWSLATIIIKHRVGAHDRAKLIHALDRVTRSRGTEPVVLPVRQPAQR